MICSCGKSFEVKSYGYKRMYPDLCQVCARKFNREKMSTPIHGHRKDSKRTPIYIKWVQMRMACYTPTNKDYRLIGALGITMCEEWQTYEGFHKWAGHRCGPGQKLKRIDITKNFEPDNCTFISDKANRFYEYEGEKLTFDTWKRRFNSQIKNEIIRTRLERKWLIPDAFTFPVGKKLGRNKRTKRSEQ